MRIKFLLWLPLLTLSVSAGKDHSYFEISFDKENREIHFRDFVNGDRRQIIGGPAEYINCESRVKRRLRGALKFSDTQLAKNFPIFDRTTFKVWHTNQRGQFDIELPGNCDLIIGTFNKRGIGTAFLSIQAEQNAYDKDIVLPSSAFVMQIAEAVPDQMIEERLFEKFKAGSTWPLPKDPLICINGSLPKDVLDFHPFVINLDTKEYFSGIDYNNDRFEVKFTKTSRYIFVAYANKPREKVTIFLIQPGNAPVRTKDHHDCIPVLIRLHKDVTYIELKKFDILKEN